MAQNAGPVNPHDRSPIGLLRTARLVWQLMQDARVSPLLKLIVPASLLYLLFPIDILPDFFFGPGQLDDLGVILLGLWLFLELAPKRVVREYTERGEKAVDVSYRVVDDEAPPSEPPALPPGDGPEPG